MYSSNYRGIELIYAFSLKEVFIHTVIRWYQKVTSGRKGLTLSKTLWTNNGSTYIHINLFKVVLMIRSTFFSVVVSTTIVFE